RGGGARAPRAYRAGAVKYVLLTVAAVVTLAAAVLLGPANVPLRDIVGSPIVWQLRLPRAVLAFLVGGALGVSGVALQALVRNPLADPFLLGLSGGAGLGAVVAIAFDLPGPWALPLAAFVGAVSAMALVYRLGLVGGAELGPRILLLGFVGLIVPHLCRLVWGRLHRALFPTAFLAGGILLAAADTLARTVVAPRELPVGIVTALLGVPVFAFLLRRWTVS